MKTKPSRPRIGDVFEIVTPNGIAYFQYSHLDPVTGNLIRVLPGLYTQRPESLAELVHSEERFFVFFPLANYLAEGAIEHVGNEALPERVRKFPLLRMAGGRSDSGKVLNWWLYDGDRQWPVKSLEPGQESLSLAQIWSDDLLIENISEGWSPATSPADQSMDMRTTNEPPSNPDEGTSISPDQAVLDELQRAGSDLTQVHRLRHYLYFPTEAGASNAAKQLREDGYVVEVRPGADDVSWLALAEHDVLPTIETISEIGDRFEQLAASLEGEYDGWEGAVSS